MSNHAREFLEASLQDLVEGLKNRRPESAADLERRLAKKPKEDDHGKKRK